MDEPFYNTIKKHALRDQPEEACGLIFKETGVLIARPQQNVWEPAEDENPGKDRRNNYRIAPLRVARALRSQTLVGIYHSHVEQKAEFTELDKAVSEKALLPTYLYSVRDDAFNVYYPTGTQPGLIGRPYLPYIHDCIELVRDKYRQALNIELPPLPYTAEEMARGKKTGIAEYLNHYGWRPVSQVRPFDLIIMMIRCHGYPNHIGVIDEEGNLLHHLHGKLSRVDPYGGFWAKMTHNVMRHPSFFKAKP